MLICSSTFTYAGVLALLPDDIDEKLKKLVVGVVARNLQDWRAQSAGKLRATFDANCCVCSSILMTRKALVAMILLSYVVRIV